MEDAWSEDAWTDEEETHTTYTAPKKQLVRQVKDYIDENYTLPLTLQTIATSFYINKEYLASLFKETYGFTVNSYIAHVRVGKAEEMLRFTDKSVSEIGYAVGIADENTLVGCLRGLKE